jgi:hypothetical protein
MFLPVAASTSLGAAHQSLNIAKEHLKVKVPWEVPFYGICINCVTLSGDI